MYDQYLQDVENPQTADLFLNVTVLLFAVLISESNITWHTLFLNFNFAMYATLTHH